MASLNRNASAVQTMYLKLNLTAKSGKQTYHLRSFLLTRKPAEIRLWATVPIAGRVFDMASDGTQFELSVPPRNKFYVGQNSVIPEKVSNPLEQLRPQIILNALPINPILPPQQTALDPGTDGDVYDVLVFETNASGYARLARRITFSRYDLLPHRQIIYDRDGVHRTIATYNSYTVRNDLPVPTDILISRPVERYSLRMQLARDGITLNAPTPVPNPFALQPAPGMTVIKLSSLASQAADDGGGGRPY
ncbi:MAG: hypothetical protein ACRD1L_05060 [Terriglobales bacterium]